MSEQAITGKIDQNTKPQFVTYLRVSTERQGQSGLGLDAQRASIDSFLKRVGASPHSVMEFVEVESAKSASSRPQLLNAIKRCRRQGATLLVAKLDRLSRELWFIALIRKFGVKFICADNPEINDLTLHILGAMAQYEREMISERTRLALAAAKARGVKLGNPNLSSVRNSDTTAAHEKLRKNADDFAREILPEIERAQHQGANSLRAVARSLNAMGLKTRRGSKWTSVSVSRVLRRTPSDDPLEGILNF